MTSNKKIKMEDDLNNFFKWKTTSKIKWKTNQSTKINLIGCDSIVYSPSKAWKKLRLGFDLVVFVS